MNLSSEQSENITKLVKKVESALSKLVHEAVVGKAAPKEIRNYGMASRELYDYYNECLGRRNYI